MKKRLQSKSVLAVLFFVCAPFAAFSAYATDLQDLCDALKADHPELKMAIITLEDGNVVCSDEGAYQIDSQTDTTFSISENHVQKSRSHANSWGTHWGESGL